MSERPTAAVVIPALNEADAIGPVVHAIARVTETVDLPVTIVATVVVDNGSTDRTADVARSAGARVVLEPRRGYGRACLTGVEAVPDVDIVILMDGDGSDPFEEAGALLAPLVRGEADLVIGSRVGARREPGSLTMPQLVGNRLATLLFGVLYHVKIDDNGPFRVIRRADLMRLGMTELTYGWSIEMTAKAVRSGLRVREVPVGYRNRVGGVSKVSGDLRASMRAGYRILGAVIRTRRAKVAPLR
jgi:glycosyltransferase involved in cell wall biosynthesis